MKPYYKRFKKDVLNVVNRSAKAAKPQQKKFERSGIPAVSNAFADFANSFWGETLGFNAPQQQQASIGQQQIAAPQAAPAVQPVTETSLGAVARGTAPGIISGLRSAINPMGRGPLTIEDWLRAMQQG